MCVRIAYSVFLSNQETPTTHRPLLEGLHKKTVVPTPSGPCPCGVRHHHEDDRDTGVWAFSNETEPSIDRGTTDVTFFSVMTRSLVINLNGRLVSLERVGSISA